MPAALAVAVGGAAGSLARFYMIVAMKRVDQVFPWGTLLVNVLGSFLIGAVWAWFLDRPDTPEWVRVGLMTGVLGGYTTLSSVSLETVLLLESGAYWQAGASVAANLGLSVLACLAALWLCRPLFAA
ncbi:MAG: fluoride efflux transporter FluC [Nevskiaceae bacterium]